MIIYLVEKKIKKPLSLLLQDDLVAVLLAKGATNKHKITKGWLIKAVCYVCSYRGLPTYSVVILSTNGGYYVLVNLD